MKKIIPGDNLFDLVNQAVKESNSTKELYLELDDLLKQSLPDEVGIKEEYEDALLQLVGSLRILKK